MGLGDGGAGAGGTGRAGLSHLQRFPSPFCFFNTFISTITLGGRKQSLPKEGQSWLPPPRRGYTACRLTGRACYCGRHVVCQESRPNKLE